MIDQIHTGFKHFRQLTNEDMEYFEVHLVEEPEHLQCMIQCIQRHITAPSDESMVRDGATECLELIAGFWRRLYEEISSVAESTSRVGVAR